MATTWSEDGSKKVTKNKNRGHVAGIDPNSIPGKVLKQRTEDSKSGKIPMGSRGYQGPDTRTTMERAGYTQAEWKGMSAKEKKEVQGYVGGKY